MIQLSWFEIGDFCRKYLKRPKLLISAITINTGRVLPLKMIFFNNTRKEMFLKEARKLILASFSLVN